MLNFRSFWFFTVLLVCISTGLCLTGIDSHGDARADSGQKLQLTAEEQAWIQTHPVIRLAPDPEFKPIEFFNDSGRYDGMGADYARIIGNKLGIHFEIIRCANWTEVIEKAKKREIDVLNAVVRSPQREKYLIFPTPYLKIPSVIIVRKTVSEALTMEMLAGMRVVMVAGYGYVDLLHNRYPQIQVDLVEDLQTALRKVSFGMADAFVGDLATASYYIELDKITNLKLAGETEPANISGFGVRSDWPVLASILDKGVALIEDGEKKAIFGKWIHLETAPGLTIEGLRRLILAVILGLVFMIASFVVWSRTLNKQVRLRTQELQQEISERKVVEQALRESEKRFVDLAENSSDWIWEVDEDGVFMYSSPSVEDVMGYTVEEITGQSGFDQLASYGAEESSEQFRQFSSEKRAFTSYITVNKRADGSDVVVESSGVPIIDSKGVFRGYRGITRNITERTELEEQLRQSHKMEAIGTMAGGIAHDFNNILAAIIGYTELAKMDLPLTSKVHESLDEVLLAGKRARDLIKQILTFGRRSQETLQPMEVHPVVTEALNLMRASLPTTITIYREIDEECGYVLANPTNIHQIVVNLCTNASHAIPEEKGEIKVTLKRVSLQAEDIGSDHEGLVGDFVELSVADNGHGMSRETMERVFEPYFTTKEIDKGSGMGLAVVHGIVEDCGGHVKIDSEEGRGTVFRIYFPVIYREMVRVEDDPRKAGIPRGDERVLVVDDEKTVLSLLAAMLERHGYRVTALDDSTKALELLRKTPGAFDLVITDQTMPGVRGSDLALEILRLKPDMLILLCTGYSASISESKAKALGITEFMLKPMNQKKLLTTVRRILDEAKW